MREEFTERLQALPEAKRIAVAIYGESVAAYRYGVLVDKSVNDEHRRIFKKMQQEELGHQASLERLASEHFPDADFVLSPRDKELVIVGTRMLEVHDAKSFRQAMQFLRQTERRTGQFYATLEHLFSADDLKRFMREMSEECFEHADELNKIKPPETR